jgi:hypothetical protein
VIEIYTCICTHINMQAYECISIGVSMIDTIIDTLWCQSDSKYDLSVSSRQKLHLSPFTATCLSSLLVKLITRYSRHPRRRYQKKVFPTNLDSNKRILRVLPPLFAGIIATKQRCVCVATHNFYKFKHLYTHSHISYSLYLFLSLSLYII